MAPSAALKEKLGHVSKFVQNTPQDGKPATEATEVWFGRTKTELYFVFICHDRHPNLIRSHLARRENILKDDYVSVLLDTFQDHRKGVLFSVNAAGVQADAIYSDTDDADYSYDQVWNSDGHINNQGWMGLIAIPFRSLRFNPTKSDWGVVFERNFPRNSEDSFWPYIAANTSGILTQEGTLSGLEGGSGSHNIQFNPYVLGQSEKTLNVNDPLNPFFSSRQLEGTAGGEVKAILKDSLVFDATINPDFSDIETDQPQFTVDQRYAVYFPELRPFFLENSNYFSTPFDLVYTRNMIHPQYGVRLTGRVANTNIGFLLTDDRAPGENVGPGDPLYKKRASAMVGRVSQDFGKNFSLGALYTDYEFGEGYNRIGGIDFTARLGKQWIVLGQAVASATKGDLDSGTKPTYSAGPAYKLVVSRNGHAFNMNANYRDLSEGFTTQLGFISSVQVRTHNGHMNYQWYPKSKIVQSFGLEANESFAFDRVGNRVYRYLSFDPFWLLPRNTVIAPIIGQNSDTVGPPSYSTLTRYVNFTENQGGIVIRSAPTSYFNFRFQAFTSGNVNYNPPTNPSDPALVNPFLMHEQTVSMTFSFQPMKQLTTDNVYLLDRNHAVSNGAMVFENQVFRTKINYQFTRELSARIITEYDTTLANPLMTSLQRTKQIQTQALLTWLPHPGTAVYIGYNNDIQNLDRSLCNRLLDNTCDPNNTSQPRSNNYLNDGKQIFVKASYLFRF